MRKRIHLLISLLLLFFLAFACNEAKKENKQENPPKEIETPPPPADTLLNYKDFTYEQFQAWDTATLPWIRDDFYGRCLKKHNIKLDCDDCENFHVQVELTIDKEGKILELKEIEADSYCLTKKTPEVQRDVYDCMIESFKKTILPKEFHDKKLLVRIGEGMGC